MVFGLKVVSCCFSGCRGRYRQRVERAGVCVLNSHAHLHHPCVLLCLSCMCVSVCCLHPVEQRDLGTGCFIIFYVGEWMEERWQCKEFPF